MMRSMISPDGVCRLQSIVGMSEGGGQPLDPAPEGPGKARVNVGTIFGISDRLAAVLSGLKFCKTRDEGAVPAALFDDAHDFGNGLGGVGKLTAGGFGGGVSPETSRRRSTPVKISIRPIVHP